MPKASQKIGEANFKVAVFQEFFGTKKFGFMQEVDRIDFVITDISDRHLIWAETKKNTADTVEMFVQLILTIGKARTFDRYNPPPFLCVFDYQKIVFLPYNDVHDIFYQNDFNWNITPSDHKSKEFQQIKSIVEKTVENKKLSFSFDNDRHIIKEFIKNNFSSSPELFPELTAHIQIDKNNFVPTYNRWVEIVKPSIDINWDIVKTKDIIDGDFYLADLLSENNITLKEKLFVLLKNTNYELDRHIDDMGLFSSKTVPFKDGGLSHKHFWEIYIRPPKEEYLDYIVERRDLLVPQDVRERKGAFFTPKIWVAKAHEYLSKTFGENWQDEYYVWDNSAGSGNLLAGLINKDNIWASTLDKQDVDVMYDRIENGANLWPENVFQFDFLNDEIKPVSKGGKIPDKLYTIINDKEKRQKIIFLINPPYGEAGNVRTRSRKGTDNEAQHKAGVQESKIKDRFKVLLGKSLNEKYIQFFARIHADIPDCKMAAFVKPKYICGNGMINFRMYWKAKYLGGFATPATTHDNCTGEYPICFFIWDLVVKNDFPEKVPCDIFNEKSIFEGVKIFYPSNDKTINDWIVKYKLTKEDINNNNYIGIARCDSPDFQRNSYCWIALQFNTAHAAILYLNAKNLLPFMVYFAVRHCIEHLWINDSDQYFYPKKEWENDTEFHNDCIAFTLFNSYNKIKIREGTNHWIPYTEVEIGCKSQFESRFMSNFIKNRIFSAEAQAVLDTGKELWRYYHLKAKTDKNANINAAFYDIREYFQGSKNGKMNISSKDDTYNKIIKSLRECSFSLAKKIKPKVYEYGFLLK